MLERSEKKGAYQDVLGLLGSDHPWYQPIQGVLDRTSRDSITASRASITVSVPIRSSLRCEMSEVRVLSFRRGSSIRRIGLGSLGRRLGHVGCHIAV
jgi:hypothetical protein